MDTHFDQYVQRLQNLEPFEIKSVNAKGEPCPWYSVKGDIVRELVIFEGNIQEQVQLVASQIAHWGRLTAQAKLVWDIETREFRRWKAEQVLQLSEPPDDPKAAAVWKKPSEAKIEAAYRTQPEYAKWSIRVEKAEEAFNAATFILDAFKAKAQILRWAVFRGRDENLHFLTP